MAGSPQRRSRPPILDSQLWFPDPGQALGGTYAGLLAIGGDLSVDRLLLAYRSGIFPWSEDPITWWSPNPRAIFKFGELHVSRSLARFQRKQPYRFTHDRAFRRVMECCAEPTLRREQSWIGPRFLNAYAQLHEAGHAHSIEAWRGEELVGGIYGVAIGGFFAGESMFSRADNASKLALLHLMEHLQERGFILFDSQVMNPTTEALGAINVRRQEYLQRLTAALEVNAAFE
jgi:leucyl/phenylalanyl-tRNA--protein transferase